MDDLREAALGYYNNNPQIQEPAREFFQRLDTNHDGRISLPEFVNFFSRSQDQYSWIQNQASFFEQLDHNGDGSLDFLEVMTFYYIAKTRTVLCRKCSTNLFGLYFTCTTCFDHNVVSYDLCLSCYRTGNFQHDHERFMDSYMLLRTRTGAAAVAAAGNIHHIPDHVEPNTSLAPVLYSGRPQNRQPVRVNQAPIYIAQANAPNQLQVQQLQPPRRLDYWQFLNAVNIMNAAVNLVPGLAAVCTIM